MKEVFQEGGGKQNKKLNLKRKQKQMPRIWKQAEINEPNGI